MSQSSQFEHLCSTWAEHPNGTACAAVAEGYRKQGALEEAKMTAEECRHRWPGFLPGYLVHARILRDLGDMERAETTLRDALAVDPSHPVVFGQLAEIAELTGHPADARAWRQMRQASLEPATVALPTFLAAPASPASPWADDEGHSQPEDELPEPDEEVLTESLAALYQAQGHLERAAEVYHVLAERSPDNSGLVGRRDGLLEEIARRRPRPYDARQSHGVALGAWLRRVAHFTTTSELPVEAGYDAFFRSPATREVPEDFEAFQSWLKGLGR